MKTPNTISVIILLLIMAGCGGRSNQSTDDLIVIDVTESYSTKKELILQDFMDVEYIALETNDEFLNQGVVMDIGKEIIAVKNQVNDGNIYVYDRKGNALRKINRRGQSGEEYINISSLILDEDNKEMFVFETSNRKIIVYDLFGNFIRSFGSLDTSNPFTKIYNYDKDNLICYDNDNSEIPFVLISKRDGHITEEIIFSFKEKKSLQQRLPLSSMNMPPDLQIPDGFQLGGRIAMALDAYRPIIPYNGNWILLEFSSDTIYTFLPDYNLRPIIVRTPSIQSMTPEVMLTLRLVTERYYFMETIRNEYNFNNNSGFPRTYFMYDKKAKNLSRYAVYNSDFSTKKEIYMVGFTPVQNESESWQTIETYQLVESYKRGELKDGRLKEIAVKLDPEDNPVIMIVKHKK